MQTYTATTEWVAGLPEMFHQYLLGLAEAALGAGEGAQRFILEPAGYGIEWGEQAVSHITQAHPEGVRYLIFGFKPVAMTMDVMTPGGEVLLVPAQAA